MTVLANRSRVREAVLGPVGLAGAVDALRAGFVAPRDDLPAAVRARTDLPGDAGTATALLPGVVAGVPAYTVKTNAKFPQARPALRGVVCLHGLDDGRLLMIGDSAEITAWRTGLAAALGSHTLARADATRVSVVGAGAQAWITLAGLVSLREVDALAVCDLVPLRAERFAARAARRYGMPVTVVPDAAAAVRAADITVLATWSTRPLLERGQVPAGHHLTSLGADEPGKVELSSGVLRRSLVVVDDAQLVGRSGALGNVGMLPGDADAELGQVLAGVRAGRTSPDQTTVYAPIGLPWQDLALAWPVFQAVSADAPQFDLLA
ncbi:MAG TPA: ornithine cyclodeaminase family protein [Actinocatenispora sp.]